MTVSPMFGAVHVLEKADTIAMMRKTQKKTGSIGLDKNIIAFDVYEKTNDDGIFDVSAWTIKNLGKGRSAVFTNTDTDDYDQLQMQSSTSSGPVSRQGIEDLLANNKVRKAIDLMLALNNVDMDEDDKEDIRNDMILISGRLNSADGDRSKGTISTENYNLSVNRIKYAMNDHVKKLPSGQVKKVNESDVIQELITKAKDENRLNPFAD